jgi:hypothetical protein
MKRILYITGLCLSFFLIHAQSNTWSGCKGGFEYTFEGIFADPISDRLYVSGFPGKVDGLEVNCIASWNGQKWDSLGHGALGAGSSFITRYKNKLYVTKGQWLYAWDFSTLSWDTVSGGFIDGYIKTACIDQNNDLIFVGEFSHIGTQSIQNIARFDGTNFSPIGNPTFPVYIRTVAVYQNEIYIGGNFYPPYKGVAKWDGTQWVSFGEAFAGANEEVSALKVYHNKLYAGGTWVNVGAEYSPSLAAWDGAKWNSVGGIYYDHNPWGVVAQLLEKDGKLYVCGNFNRAAGLPVDNIAIWNDTNWCGLNTVFESPAFLSAVFRDTLYLANHLKIDNDSVRGLGYYIGSNYIGTCGAPVGINETKLSETIKIYPNPTTSSLHILDEQNDLSNSSIEISNNIGQTILQMPFSSSINVSTLPEGCYFITITTKQDQLFHSKFVKH